MPEVSLIIHYYYCFIHCRILCQGKVVAGETWEDSEIVVECMIATDSNGLIFNGPIIHISCAQTTESTKQYLESLTGKMLGPSSRGLIIYTNTTHDNPVIVPHSWAVLKLKSAALKLESKP